MKKVSVLIFIGMLGGLLGGCGDKTEAKSLSVYIVQEDALYDSAMIDYLQNYQDVDLDVEYFETYDDVNERLNTELMSGEGPDVLLFNSLYSDVDPYKMAGSGMFLALDEQVAELDGEAYFSELLDAGKVNGHQYYIPLSWNVLQVYSTPEKVTGEDLYTSMLTEAEAIAKDTSVGLTTYKFLRNDWMNYFMEIAGNSLIDVETGNLREQKEGIQQTAEFLKVLYGAYDQSATVGMKYNKDFAGGITHMSYNMGNISLLTDLRFFESTYPKYTESEMAFSTFERQDGEGITAQVIQYGAINANTENKEAAWQLLQSIMDVQPTVNFARTQLKKAFYAPVNIAAYEECVRQLTIQKGPTGGTAKVGPLSSKYGEVMKELPEKISEAVIPNLTYGEIVQECMESYLKGGDSFDSCYDKLVQQTELYLSE